MANAKDKHFWDETRKPWMDLENERKPIKPQKSGKNASRANELTGTTNQQLAGFFQDMVMEKAMRDRVKDFARIDTPEAPQVSFGTVGELSDVDNDGDDESPRFVGSGDDIDAIRARRLMELQKNASQQNKFAAMGHGAYTEITEPEFLEVVTKSPRIVVHFYHDEFARCKAVDKNMCLIAPLVLGCRFVKINANKCPFFVSKLNIKVLPTIVCFVEGKTVHRLVGFAELGGIDDFSLKSFIENLRTHKMLKGSDESKWKSLCSNKDTSDYDSDDSSL